jgi:hypothetical protein
MLYSIHNIYLLSLHSLVNNWWRTCFYSYESKRCYETEDKIKSKIDELLRQLSKNSKTVEGLQSTVIAVKEYASDLQTFLGSKTIDDEVTKVEEEYIMALSSSSCRILCSSVSKCEFILTRISLIWSWNICRCCLIFERFVACPS